MAFLKKDMSNDRMILTTDPHANWTPWIDKLEIESGKPVRFDPADKSNYFIKKKGFDGK